MDQNLRSPGDLILTHTHLLILAKQSTVSISAQKANGTCSPIFTAALGQPRETLSSSRKLLGQSPPTQPKTKSAPPLRKRIETCYPIFTAALGQPRETLSSSQKLLGQSPPTQPQTKSAPPLRKRTEPVLQSSPLHSDSQGKRCHPLGSFSDSRLQLNQRQSPHLCSESERNLFSNLHRCARTAKGNVVILSEASRTVTFNSTKNKVRTSAQKANRNLLSNLHRCTRTAKGNVVILSEASQTVTSNSTKDKVRTSAQKANGTCSPIFTAALGLQRETLSSSRKLLRQSPPTQPKTKSAPPLRKRTEPVLQSSPLRSDSQGKRCHPLRSFSDSRLQLNQNQSPHLRSESERNLLSNLHRCARTAKGNVVILSEASRTVTSNSSKAKVRASAQKANGTCSPIFTAALGQPRETLSSSRKLLGQSPPTKPQTKSAPPLRKRIETCSPIFTAALGQPRETLSSSRKLLGQSPPTQPKPKSAPLFRKRTETVIQSSQLHSDSQGKRCHPLRSFSDSHLQLNQNQSPHLRSESE